jgi:hypothetical protein
MAVVLLFVKAIRAAYPTSAPVGLATSAARLLQDLAQYRRPPTEVPAKTDGRHMAPDDSADSTGERLEARYPGSRTGHKRILSHRWDS